jgi:hypothetical protein
MTRVPLISLSFKEETYLDTLFLGFEEVEPSHTAARVESKSKNESKYYTISYYTFFLRNMILYCS